MTSSPLALIAELTHRCPLRCVYCSNPIELKSRKDELGTSEWIRVFHEAAQLGVVQVHLTGGEPLLKADLTEMINTCHSLGLYTNLITSGVGLKEESLQALVREGLDHIQLSFQDVNPIFASQFSGVRSHQLKVAVAKLIRKQTVAFTINIVVHRHNLDRLKEMIAFAEELGPDRLEIAHVQYNGWALKNRDLLLPSRTQVLESIETIKKERLRLEGKMKIEFVTSDYHAKYPKACMGGWGQKTLLVDPEGRALPCHSAGVIPGLQFPNIREMSLSSIWYESVAFLKFRGTDELPDPCRTCHRREKDFGGCRCQAFVLTGDPLATDPVCIYSPHRKELDQLIQRDLETFERPLSWQYRMRPDK